MMRPTAIKGARAVAYYDTLVPDQEQVVSGERVEDYYLSTDEQPGVWWGAAAGELGLVGEGSRDEFHALMDGLDPRSGEPLGRRQRRDGVRGFDLTFSAPKSVSVLSAVCGEEVERAMVEAHDAALAAVMGAIEERATTRSGTDGVYRVDVTGLAALLVRHRTSRALDPQLHTHAVVAAKVKSVDGRWRALDAAMVFRDQRTLGAIYQAALRAELTARLGVAWGPVVKGQAEILGVEERLLEAFSRRAGQVQRRLRGKLAAFARAEGRDPSRREWSILARDAARESRPAKVRGRDAGELRGEWLQTAEAHGFTGEEILETVARAGEPQLAPTRAGGLDRLDGGAELAGEVVATLATGGSVWTISDVQREVAGALPTGRGGSASEQVRRVEAVAARIVAERCVDLAPAEARGVALDALSEPGVQRYSTPGLVEQEQRIVGLFQEAAADVGGPVVVGERLARGLDAEQAAAAALVAGRDGLVVVIGPAGAGKTRAMSAAVRALEAQGRPVLGLAPWAVAAEELARETGVRAETVERFLRQHEPEQPSLDAVMAPAGSTVIVDEAGLLRTEDAERLMRLARDHHWRVALVGDSRQLAAVGRSGMFDQARTVAPVIQLREVRRFQARWERKASVALRECDPEALDAYRDNGRVKAGSAHEMERALVDDWWQTVSDGRRGAFTVSTNDQARRLNDRARRRLVGSGAVDDDHVFTTAAGERVGVGDEVQTRRNDRAQRTELGQWVRNRQRWRVQQVLEDGRVVVRGRGGEVTLDADYSREHVELAYFTTVHSAQGLTRDVSATLVDELAGWRSLYVGMTRGRARNTAYVVLGNEEEARPVLERALRRDRADLGALGVQRRLFDDARLMTQRRVRELQDEQARLRASSGQTDRERLEQVRQELEQLQPGAPTASAPQPGRPSLGRRAPGRTLGR